MKYFVEFIHQVTNGRTLTSRVFTKSLKDSDKVIKEHLADHRTPRVERWRLWELKKEGTANEG